MKKLKDILLEAEVFDPAIDAAPEDATMPSPNLAIKKFDLILKGKQHWEKFSELVPNLSDQKQMEVVMMLLDELGITDIAKKKLKARMG